MLPGSNTNIRHGGVLFHVQTEDSGRAHPHVITHLYHGGTILASEKSSYAQHVDAPDLPARVRGQMDAQHHAMLKRLASGELDEQIEQRLGPDVFSAAASEKSKSATHTQRGITEPERTLRPAPARSESTATAEAPAAPVAASEPATTPAAPAGRPLDEIILDYLVDAARSKRNKRRAE
ncbi:MAG: hypothetical protein MUF70_02245 [Myxococcota bacterium]|jgi:hypothetical protein|nr:hypothetical protein [Myxococcota bacterium]